MNTHHSRFHGLAHIQRAAPKKGFYFEFMTWNEAKNTLQQTYAVLLPLGSNMKQHGMRSQ